MANTTGKKYGGRTKGTPNRNTALLRDKVNQLLEDRWDQVLEDISSLHPKDRVDTFIKLMEYALPKLNRTEMVDDTMNMTQEERLIRIRELKSKLEADGYFD
ncbi:hypothetical protein [Maribacter flavus]|uniref:hypothetical protein n=1 Tax=Maribacter flavus TaxID=1658664 RepID=UPI001B87E9AC|nr:hypothetical protein [Maribacter flavus]